MALSIFDDKSTIPDISAVIKILEKSGKFWNEIAEFVYQRYPKAIEEWKYPGKNYGWSFRLKDKKRIIIYLTPQKGYFFAALVFGDKSVSEVLKSSVSGEIKEMLLKAKKYIEGRGIRIEVKNSKPVKDIKKLIEIKLNS